MTSKPSTTTSLARSSAVMASGTLVSRILGLVRMAMLAWAIGIQTPAGNIWQTANTIPNTIYLLIAAGVLNVLLLPQLTRAMTRGKEGQEFSDRLLTLSAALLVAATVLFVLAAPLVTKVTMLTYPWGHPMLDLAILFAYLCIPQMLFYGLHTLLGQVLAAYHRFAAFSWSPALANVIAIAGILVFRWRYPDAAQIPVQDWTAGMIGILAGSATLSIVVQALVLFPAVRATGFRWRLRWGFRGVGLGTASVMAGWALADIALAQAGVLTATNLLNWAVKLVPDAPGKAAYDYAFSIFILPHSLIAMSLLTTIYPVLAKAAAVDDRRGMASHTATGLRMLGTAMVPIAIGMVLLAPLLTRVLYPLNPEAHEAISHILVALVVGLVPYGIYLLCARVFYSFEDARTPFLFQVSITSVLLVVCLLSLLQAPGHVAILIALGQAVGQTVAAVLSLRAVRRRLPWIGLRAVGGTYLRAAAAAVVALLPAWVVVRLLDRPGPLFAVLALALGGGIFVVTYAVLAHRLGVQEITAVARPLLGRLGRVPALQRLLPAAPSSVASAAVVPEATPGEEVPGATGPFAPSSSAPRAARPDGVEPVDEARTLGWDSPVPGADGKDDHMDGLEAGSRLGERYTLDELLARREDGTLDYWSARDSTLGRLVAVTVVPATGEHAEVADAVLDGARRVASVDDARLVRVLDVGSEDGLAWVVEEGLTDAESLASLVSSGPLPAEEARRVVGEAAAALESARRRGLHHLYLNPHSVLRTGDGTIKVSGVGVASALEGTDDVTAAEASLIDAADLVSLLYTGLTGTWPGEEIAGVRPARRLDDGSYAAPSESVGGVPGDLDTLCRVVLGTETDLSDAPHTPGALAHQIAPWSPEQISADRPGTFSPPAAPSERAGGTGSGAAAAAAGTGSGAGAPGDDDATAAVPKPYYRGSADRAAPGHGAVGAEDELDVFSAETSGDRTGDVGRQTTADLLGIRSTGDRITPRPRPAGARTGPRPPGDGSGLVRAGAGLDEERGTGGQTVAVLLVLLGILGLAAVLGWSVLNGLGGDDDTPAAQSTVSTPADPDQTGATSAPGSGTPAPEGTADSTVDETTAPPAAAGSAPQVLGITSFDPQGDGDENNDQTPLAVDGDESTAWTSHTYYSPGWGGLKDGTGLILDLGEGASVSEVDVLLGDGEVGLTAYLAEQPSLSGAQELATSDDASGTWTASPGQPVTGRYLILWFDRAYASPEGEVVSVREITVR